MSFLYYYVKVVFYYRVSIAFSVYTYMSSFCVFDFSVCVFTLCMYVAVMGCG